MKDISDIKMKSRMAAKGFTTSSGNRTQKGIGRGKEQVNMLVNLNKKLAVNNYRHQHHHND